VLHRLSRVLQYGKFERGTEALFNTYLTTSGYVSEWENHPRWWWNHSRIFLILETSYLLVTEYLYGRVCGAVLADELYMAAHWPVRLFRLASWLILEVWNIPRSWDKLS